MRPVLKYASVVWDPHQRHLKSTLEMVHVLKYLCPGGSAPARKPEVHEKVRQDLHDVQNHERSCQRKPCCRSARAQKPQLEGTQIPTPSPPLQNRHTCIPPISNPTLELCPHRCSISRDSACLQNCTVGLDGRTCLIVIRISFFLTCFNCTTK